MSKRKAMDKPSKKIFDDTPELWPDIAKLDSEIMGPIAHHLQKRFDDESICIARQFRGGWEVWLQIELATELLKERSWQVNTADNGFIVERETTVWNRSGTGKGQGQCDLWIQPNLDHNNKPTAHAACVIELKVDYEYFTGKLSKSGDFQKKTMMVRDRFILDLKKIQSGLNDAALSKIKDSGIRIICMAVTSYPEDLVGWKDVQNLYQTTVRYVWLRERKDKPDSSPGRGGLALIWWETEILPAMDQVEKKLKAKM